MVSRYNTELDVWEVGVWINDTRFHVIDIVQDYDELAIYQEAA
jgi:hypothetical protein